jgi:SAM-dependent methyltransferase
MDRLLSATARAEDHHFWFVGMRRFARLMLDRVIPARRPLRIIDCGAGTGRNLDWLRDYGWVMGLELSPTGLAIARRHGRPRLVRGTVAALPVPDGAFDLATSFDVIYSLDDETERRALAEMHRVLRPGGIALVNAAALDILTGSHATLAQERRRYTTTRLRAKLDAAGFDVLSLSYTMMTTLPLTLAVRLAQRASGHGGEAAETEMAVPAAPVNGLLKGMLWMEAALLRITALPVGSSVLCVARRR